MATRDVWRATHACTLFLSVGARWLRDLVHPALTPWVDRAGRGQIEVGFVRFPSKCFADLPATDELAWGVRVQRKKGYGFAFQAMNILADNARFLDHVEQVDGFRVHRGASTTFRVDPAWRSYEVADAHGTVCTLRLRTAGTLGLPVFPGTTEVWSAQGDDLYRREFAWRGVARLALVPEVASNLFSHPFFDRFEAHRVHPVPVLAFTSQVVATKAAQVFTRPSRFPPRGPR